MTRPILRRHRWPNNGIFRASSAWEVRVSDQYGSYCCSAYSAPGGHNEVTSAPYIWKGAKSRYDLPSLTGGLIRIPSAGVHTAAGAFSVEERDNNQGYACQMIGWKHPDKGGSNRHYLSDCDAITSDEPINNNYSPGFIYVRCFWLRVQILCSSYKDPFHQDIQASKERKMTMRVHLERTQLNGQTGVLLDIAVKLFKQQDNNLEETIHTVNKDCSSASGGLRSSLGSSVLALKIFSIENYQLRMVVKKAVVKQYQQEYGMPQTRRPAAWSRSPERRSRKVEKVEMLVVVESGERRPDEAKCALKAFHPWIAGIPVIPTVM
ncbi:hypothetical protein CLF_104261 [Clonorchis sinensis]|uniref:Uncharacterized protein n=1 Tax=Clonorchis sinensis TaxID=79923 RepID=G7YB94_CLOSI|nr:hypothetical protein CLF_104261 [Clonorchis sinensis]